MLRVTLDNVGQKRTIRPLYANHQATPYSCFLDPNWDRSVDIYPGMVMTKLDGEKVTLFTLEAHTVFGLSALFVAPKLGIDELRNINHNVFAAWVGDNQSVFEILAPAFDTSATWVNPTDGSEVLLRVTIGAHAQGPGKITNAASGATVSTDVVGRLIQVVGTNKIVINLDRKANA